METDSGIGRNGASSGPASRRFPDRLRSLEALWRQHVPKLFRWISLQKPKLRVEVSASEIVLFNTSQHGPMARYQYHNTPSLPVLTNESLSECELILNNELGVVTRITFPEEAEAMLDSLIGMMLERYIPFREEEVHFDYRITKRDREKGEIVVKIYAVPCATMERVQEHLAGLGLSAATIDMLEASTGSSPVRAGVNLLRPADEEDHSKRRFHRVMMLVTVLALIASATIPIYRHYFSTQYPKEFKTIRMNPHDSGRPHGGVDGNNGTLKIIMERKIDATQNPLIQVQSAKPVHDVDMFEKRERI